jgi:hypothetical protein
MIKNFEERLARKGWVFQGILKNVKVFIRSEFFDSKKSKEKLVHIGFLQDNHWYNYCVFNGDALYLEHHLEHFLIQNKMGESWKQRIKNIKDN